MINEKLVQNVEFYCKKKGVKPTPACEESGVGRSFLSNIKRGNEPKTKTLQKLAKYLGVTVSDLLGEEKPADTEDGGFASKYKLLAPDDQKMVEGMIDRLLSKHEPSA